MMSLPASQQRAPNQIEKTLADNHPGLGTVPAPRPCRRGGLRRRHGSAWLPVRVTPPPAGPPATAGASPRGYKVEDQQQECRAGDGGEPGGEVEEPVQGVDVEQLRGEPAAEERPGHPDQAGEDEAL